MDTLLEKLLPWASTVAEPEPAKVEYQPPSHAEVREHLGFHRAAILAHDAELRRHRQFMADQVTIREQREQRAVGYVDSDGQYRTVGFISGPPPPKTLPVPKKSAVAVADDSPDEEYLLLAAKLGIRSSALQVAELERILAEEMIQIYDYAKVCEYLANECRRMEAEQDAQSYYSTTRYTWGWKPLREQDRSNSNNTAPVYAKAVPYPVLLTVDKIASRLPEARFYVSEIESHPDPFLAVMIDGCNKCWVVERWDEPGFRS